MKFNRTFFILVYFLSINSSAETVAPKDTSVSTSESSTVRAEIASRLHTVAQCKQKIWPGQKMGQYPMYLVDASANTVDLINVEKGTIEKPSNETIAAIKKEGEKAYYLNLPGGSGGGTAVSINMKPRSRPQGPASEFKRMCEAENKKYMEMFAKNDSGKSKDPVDSAINLLAHESFHGVDQNDAHVCSKNDGHDWNMGNGFQRTIKGSLETKIEVSSIRANIIHNLNLAARCGDSSDCSVHLNEAVKWYNLLETKYKSAVEELRTVDRIEGAASYAGFKAASIGKHGCDNDLAVKKEILSLADAESKLSTVPGPLDTQSYGLGVLAGIILDGRKLEGWKGEVEKGKTPMQVLASFVGSKGKGAPKDVESNRAAREAFKNSEMCNQRETLKPIVEAHQNPEEYVAVSVPVEGVFANVGSTYPYEDTEWQNSRYQNAGVAINNWPKTSVADGALTCPSTAKGYMVVLVPRSTLTESGDGKSFKHSNDYGSVEGTVDSTKDGKFGKFDLYCAK